MAQRKFTKREPNGRAQRTPPMARPTPERMAQAAGEYREAETRAAGVKVFIMNSCGQLGKYRTVGVITVRQETAGFRFAELARRCGIGAAVTARMDGYGGRDDRDDVKAAARWAEIRNALTGRQHDCLMGVCASDCPTTHLTTLRAGLEAVADILGLALE